MTIGMKIKNPEEEETFIIMLKILELLVLNDEAADLAITNGRLQISLNNLLEIFD